MSTFIIYGAIIIGVCVALAVLLRNIRFLYSRSPEENAADRIQNRHSWWDKFFARKNPKPADVIPIAKKK